jgi:hypothetical protein
MDGRERENRAAELRKQAKALRDLAQQTHAGSDALEQCVRLFGGEREVLLAVHQRWQTNLLARLDQVLEGGSDDIHGEVVRAVDRLSRDLPGFAALLREHAGDPVLARARGRLAAYLDQACPCGRGHPLVGWAPRAHVATGCPLLHMACRVRRHVARLHAAMVLS